MNASVIFFSAGPGAKLPVYADNAKELIVAMGRQAHGQGEVSVAQVPDVLARLRLAFEDRITHTPFVEQHETALIGTIFVGQRRSKFSLAERAAPLIELFERAQRTHHPVRWG